MNYIQIKIYGLCGYPGVHGRSRNVKEYFTVTEKNSVPLQFSGHNIKIMCIKYR
jgi:hypothetical protein